jgi:actin-related protein
VPHLAFHPFPKEHQRLLTIHYPMEHDVVQDRNDVKCIWQYIFSKDQLQTFS